MKLLPPYDPDMCHPLIKGIEYPYSIREAQKYYRDCGASCMRDFITYTGYVQAVNKEKEERLTRYNFIKD